MEKIRLQKYFTECGIMSRRAAEAEIESGKVTVNGKVALLGDKIDPAADIVMYKGKILEYPLGEHIYIMLHHSPILKKAMRLLSRLMRVIAIRVMS